MENGMYFDKMNIFNDINRLITYFKKCGTISKSWGFDPNDFIEIKQDVSSDSNDWTLSIGKTNGQNYHEESSTTISEKDIPEAFRKLHDEIEKLSENYTSCIQLGSVAAVQSKVMMFTSNAYSFADDEDEDGNEYDTFCIGLKHPYLVKELIRIKELKGRTAIISNKRFISIVDNILRHCEYVRIRNNNVGDLVAAKFVGGEPTFLDANSLASKEDLEFLIERCNKLYSDVDEILLCYGRRDSATGCETINGKHLLLVTYQE